MRRSVCYVSTLFVMLFATGVFADDKPAVKRLPPPSNEEIDAVSERVIKELAVMGRPASSAAQRALIARHLLARSKPSDSTAAFRFVCWREAQRLAIDAGDVRLSLTALDRLVRQFELAHRAELSQMLLRLVESSANATADADLVRLTSQVLREALADGDTDFGAAYETLSTVARRRLDLPLLRQATSLATEWTELNELHSAQRAVKTSDTLSPAEHQALGQFLIRRRHDWAGGLKEFQKSDDPTLAKLAQQDLANPGTPTEQFQLAEDWSRWATANDRPLPLWQLAACHYWLTQSEPRLTGDIRKQAQRRLRELGQPLLPRVAPPQIGPLTIAGPTEQELLAAFATPQTPRLLFGTATTAPQTPLTPNKSGQITITFNPAAPKNTNPPATPAPKSPTPFPPGAPPSAAETHVASRKAAEWLIAQGPSNFCTIRLADGQNQQLRDKTPIPSQPFTITYLSVSFRQPKLRDTDLSQLAGLSDLESLSLDVRDLQAADLKHLQASQKLKSISFLNASSGDPLLESLSFWPELQYLQTNRTQVSPAGLARIASHKRLQGLFLQNTRGINDACLADLARVSTLAFLELDGTELTDAGLAHLIPMPKLDTLTVVPATNISDAAVAHFIKMPALTQLVLTKSQLTDAGLGRLKPLTRLKRLSLGESKFSGTGLADLANCQELRDLSLPNCSLTEAGFAALAQLPELHRLDLAGTPISVTAAQQLARLKKLQFLTVINSRLTDESIAALATLPTLSFLNAINNELTDKSIDSLAKLQTLQQLVLLQTKITKAGAERLKQALPKCQIQGQFGP